MFYNLGTFDKGFAFETIAEPIFRHTKPRRQCCQSLYQNIATGTGRFYKKPLMGFGAEPQSVSPKGKTDPARVWRAEPG